MEIYRCVNCMGEIAKEEKVCHHCGYDTAGHVQPVNALRAETILNGRYLVGRVLGQGGFGITYVGYDLTLGIKVAIKEYFPGGFAGRDGQLSSSLQWSFTNSERQNWNDSLDNFLSEARKMAKLDEIPGIVRVRDCFKENQTAYIVMDYAEGVTLREYLKQKGRMDYTSCVRLLLPIMESLETVHEKGLVHRDISPDNLMVRKKDKELKVSLLDFGAAIDMGMEHSGKSQSIVKKGYSAPEQYMENGNVGGWSDVYSMAAVIYRCVTGTEIPEAMERVMKGAPVAMGGVSNKAARQVLTDALALKTEERTGTMAEFRKALMETLPVGGNNKKKAAVTGAAAAALLAVCGAGIWAFTAKPWLPDIVRLGSSNALKHQGANYAMLDRQYEYFTDEDWNLYVCPFNDQDAVFYIDNNTIVDTEAGFINIGKDKVYFAHDNAENARENDSLIAMNFDGSGREILTEGEYFSNLMYAELSDGREMLYYITENGDEEDFLYTLCRYDLASGKEERLLDEDIIWYNLDGRYIYYVTFEKGKLSEGTKWKRAYLDGNGAELLNDNANFLNGYIEDGTAYMFSNSSERLELCSLDGNIGDNPLGEYASAIYNGCSTYADGWIYYSPLESGEIHKIRPDGTGEEVIYTGENVLEVACIGDTVWFVTGIYDETKAEFRCDNTYLMGSNGSGVLALGGLQTMDGLRYKVKNGEVVITGYTGEADYAVVPASFEEGEWKGQVSEGFPEDVTLYKTEAADAFAFEKTADGSGIILTGYNGEEAFLALPEEIEGFPVKAVADGFMKENKTVEGIAFPAGLETIGSEAFQSCSYLKRAELPAGLKEIKDLAFFGTGIENLKIPASLESYSPSAFYGIKTVEVAEENEKFRVEDNILYEGSKLVLIGNENTGEFVVPSQVSEVCAYAGVYSQLSSIVLPGSVKRIGNYAFHNAESLRKAVISEGTEEIGWSAFSKCIMLEEVVIPQTVKSIGVQAFSGCSSLRTVTISRDCEIGEGAFDAGVKVEYYD